MKNAATVQAELYRQLVNAGHKAACEQYLTSRVHRSGGFRADVVVRYRDSVVAACETKSEDSAVEWADPPTQRQAQAYAACGAPVFLVKTDLDILRVLAHCNKRRDELNAA